MLSNITFDGNQRSQGIHEIIVIEVSCQLWGDGGKGRGCWIPLSGSIT